MSEKKEEGKFDLLFLEKVRKIITGHYGSQYKLAKKLKINESAITHWFATGRGVPKRRAMWMEKDSKGKIKANKIRPDIDQD
jgi:DNA-binding transcriptional regulator YdaS (Cro superfamily)